MYIHTIPNRKSKPAILLRESYREGGRVKNRTLANLSDLSEVQIDRIARALRKEPLLPVGDELQNTASSHHGHVQAVLDAMNKLGFANLIASRPSMERSLVMAMVVARIIAPHTKLASTRWWEGTTLPEMLKIEGADEDDLYKSMDWLLGCQRRIEKKLAGRHLRENGLVLFDLSSTYFEGQHCPLLAMGHNRDGKKGKQQINFGLLTDDRGCPVSVSVFPGNTSDFKTFMPQVDRVREAFGIREMVMVGDRGMISQVQIDQLRQKPGLAWITALRTEAIRALMVPPFFQPGLFDQHNLVEFTHPDYPNERLVACHNEALARKREATRLSLLAATVRELEKIRNSVTKGRLKGADKIGLRVGKNINKYKISKHFILDIGENSLEWRIDLERVSKESALDGIYIIRTSLPKERMSAPDTVRGYKLLTKVEQAFRSLKMMDMEVRPIHHRLEKRVRVHIFICMLAYYVKWHMMEAWRPLLFAEEHFHFQTDADPVAATQRSKETLEKVHTKTLPNGSKTHSFRTLLNSLGTIVRNTMRFQNDPDTAPAFTITTTPTPEQQKAFDFIQSIRL